MALKFDFNRRETASKRSVGVHASVCPATENTLKRELQQTPNMRGFRKFPCSNSRRFLPLAFAAFVAGLLLSGCCGHTEYVIEMEPEGGKLNRKLSIIEHPPPPTPTESGAAKAEPPPNPAETASPNVEPENFPERLRRELERVEALYAPRHSNYSSNTHTFQGSFSGKLPNDVGGAGSYLYYSNLLGTCLGIAGPTPDARCDLEKGLRKLPTAAELKPQFDALRAQIKTEASGNGDPIYDDLFSLQAWELIRSKLPEPIGDAK
ncbi:MAG: hypothetical protein ACI9VS_000893 [Candidatus Binatia bacterium]|jgi:hypothetical protein